MSLKSSNMFVFMPHDKDNKIILVQNGKKLERARYEVIQEQLINLIEQLQNIKNEDEEQGIFFLVQKCIITYNPTLQKGNFNILEDLFDELLQTNQKFFLRKLIANIASTALKLDELFPQPINILRQNFQDFVQISANQATCLLANAFFCTFSKKKQSENYFSPRINFNELYDDTLNLVNPNSWRGRARAAKIEKLKCLMNYFSKACPAIDNDHNHSRFITYERRVLQRKDHISWKHSDVKLKNMLAFDKGAIEDGKMKLQVDFANKHVGGGTLGNGSAQEEIRFSICPELIVSQLFTECLEDHEALLIDGFKQFSGYQGYGSSFKYMELLPEQVTDETYQLVALDAFQFSRNSRRQQFTKAYVLRELNKCLVGFMSNQNSKIPPMNAVASGKWGCGVFNGDPELKCIIQWMAASVSNMSLELYTFGDVGLTERLNALSELATTPTTCADCTVGLMFKLILKFKRELDSLNHHNESTNFSLIEFLKKEIERVKAKQKSVINSQSPQRPSELPETFNNNFNQNMETREAFPIVDPNNRIRRTLPSDARNNSWSILCCTFLFRGFKFLFVKFIRPGLKYICTRITRFISWIKTKCVYYCSQASTEEVDAEDRDYSDKDEYTA